MSESPERVMRPFDAIAVMSGLQGLLDCLRDTDIDPNTISSKRRNMLRAKIDDTVRELERAAAGLSVVRTPEFVLDPSEPHVIGELIADVLLEQRRYRLSGLERFYGSGVYAIYYTGDFPAYQPASGTETPLYIGKADPKTSNAVNSVEQGETLSRRLKDHCRSISAAANLDIADFECRYLVVKSAWQSTAEIYLINGFLPIWNDEVGICYGIGKHGDSAATRKNTRSPWDTLHPGRAWALSADNTDNPKSPEDIVRGIAAHYILHPPSRVSELPAGSAPQTLTQVEASRPDV